MMSLFPDDPAERRPMILALCDGRLPDAVAEDSPQGRAFRRLIEYGDADIAAAPPMTDEAKARIVALLRGARGGGPNAA